MECKVKNLVINYEMMGEGRPIIAIHGYYSDNRSMIGCLEPIFNERDGYKRIYIDLPCMGKSEGADWINSSDEMLELVSAFIDQVIPNQCFIIAGHSYGGYLTRGIIHRMRDRIAGALLICPLILPDFKSRNLPEHIVLQKDTTLLAKLTSEQAEDFNSFFVVQSERIYERYQTEIIPGVEEANAVLLKAIMKNGYGFSIDVDKLTEKVDKPVLFLLGKQDDSVGYQDAWTLLDNYPRATFTVLDQAGHYLPLEQEVLFQVHVNAWLTSVEAEWQTAMSNRD